MFSLRNIFRSKGSGAVLMYHRIAEDRSDPWDLCVSPENFEDQVVALKQRFHIIPMFRLAERIRTGETISDAIVLTFDDGYLDNLEVAARILQLHNVPATFYFTSRFAQQNKKYWWDELEQLILHTPVLPDSVNISLGFKTITLLLGDARELNESIREQNRKWRYGDPVTNSRIKLYYELWSELKTMTTEDQLQGIQRIKDWAGVHLTSTPPIMDASQIREMASTGLFEIGGHTVNHVALGTLSPPDQKHEIRENRNDLQNIIPQPVAGLAYPYGHLNSQSPAIAKSCGYTYAVTTEQRRVSLKDSLFEIPRFQVKNITGQALLAQISR